MNISKIQILINAIINCLKELKLENCKDGIVTKITGFIPKFKFDYTLSLKEDLKALGITDIFDSSKADLTKIILAKYNYVGKESINQILNLYKME